MQLHHVVKINVCKSTLDFPQYSSNEQGIVANYYFFFFLQLKSFLILLSGLVLRISKEFAIRLTSVQTIYFNSPTFYNVINKYPSRKLTQITNGISIPPQLLNAKALINGCQVWSGQKKTMAAALVYWKRPKELGEKYFHCRPQWRKNKQP